MKDYSKYLENSKDYILSYKKEDGTIVVNFADKSVVTFVYDVALEQRIIEKMRNQAQEAIKLYDYFSNKTIKFSKLIDRDGTISFVTMVECLLIIFFDTSIYSHLITLLFPFGCGMTTFFRSMLWAASKKNSFENKLYDIEKLKYFLENEHELNKSIAQGNNLMENVRKKAIQSVSDALSQNQAPVNLNNIDKFELGDLIKMRKRLDKIKELSADSEEKTEEQGKTLTKDYNTIQK